MKKSQSLSRKTRLSRSASANSARKDGWKVSIFVILGATLLLVSVFFLARLGGFGSHKAADVGLAHLQGFEAFGKNVGVHRKFKFPQDLNLQNADDLNVEEHVDENNRDLENVGETDDEEIDVDNNMNLEGAKINDDDDINNNSGTNDDEEDDDNNNSGTNETDENEADEVDEFSQQEYGQKDETDDMEDLPDGNNTSSSNNSRINDVKRLERLGQITTLPRKSPDDINTEGIIKMPQNKNKLGTGLGTNEGSLGASFSSDDEPMERSVRKRLEEVTSIEDILMVKRGLNTKSSGTSSSPKLTGPKKVFDTEFDRRVVKPPFEPWNPTGSSLLQDPDSIGPGVLTKSDKAISRALRRASERTYFIDTPAYSQDKTGTGGKELLASKQVEKNIRRRKRSRGDNRTWGYYPGLDAKLLFSEFMEEFLVDEVCELNVFMAWNSPPWAFTVRHQRGLESLLHFHPRACVTFFSETVELDFLKKFQQEGYRVAVVRPNLEELLEGTRTDIFANVWLQWRKIDLFHVHYSELLRLAALYKYGGVYLDSDIIVLKPLDKLHNTLGEEALPDTSRLNGAVMAFDKSSNFVKECLEEYAVTYDDKLIDWNGADLLTRVKSNAAWNETDLKVLPAFSFFPFSASNITRYFSRVNDDENLLKRIEEISYTLHLWHRRTGAFVPESRSLVDRVLELHCKWCDELV